MHSDPAQLYRKFLKGQPGTCIFTQRDGCHAFVTEDEIEATFSSRHDGHHFAWLTQPPGQVGFVSDDHIDELLALGRIVFTFSEMSGPAGVTRSGLKAAFLLGVSRMNQILRLTPDSNGRVSREIIDTLPLALRFQLNGLGIFDSIPFTSLITGALPLGSSYKNAESHGRLATLARAAIGQDLAGIEKDADSCAEIIMLRTAREAEADEISHQMLEQVQQLASEKGEW